MRITYLSVTLTSIIHYYWPIAFIQCTQAIINYIRLMKTQILTIKTFRMDDRLTKKTDSRKAVYERLKTKNLKSFNFARKRSLSNQKQSLSLERPKTSYLHYQFPQSSRDFLEKSLSYQHSCSQSNKKSIKQNTTQNMNKSINFFPQRKTKKLSNSKWYRYCANQLLSPQPIPINKIEKPATKVVGNDQQNSPNRPGGRGLNITIKIPKINKAKRLPQASPFNAQLFSEISPWRIMAEQQINL